MLNKTLRVSLFLLVVNLSKIFPQDSLDIKSSKLSLKDCIEIALENNHKIQASREGVKIAAAQKKQAESGYWPQLSLKAAYTLMDQDPRFIMPSSQMSLPLNLFGQSVNFDVPVPEQDVKLMDKNNFHGSIELQYPIYTGGKVQSINRQAEYGYNIAKEETRKTDLEIKNDVKKYYYAVALTENLYSIGQEALERLEATLSLTESLYKNGSGKVTKIDYLRNKVMVDQVHSLVAEIKGKINVSKEALRFVLASDIPENFEISSSEIPDKNYNLNADSIINEAYYNNPDWLKVNSAVKVFESKIDEAESGFLPNLALFGSLNQNINPYNYGIVGPDNRTIWTVGLGMEMPIFSGFRTAGEVDEAKARLNKTVDEKRLLHDAIILQVRNACNDIKTTEDQVEKTLEAKNTAEENRSLNERAFQLDMVEAKDLIEAQIMESFVKAQYQKALYDHLIAQANLEMIIGKDIN